jgi:hypothetical protein
MDGRVELLPDTFPLYKKIKNTTTKICQVAASSHSLEMERGALHPIIIALKISSGAEFITYSSFLLELVFSRITCPFSHSPFFGHHLWLLNCNHGPSTTNINCIPLPTYTIHSSCFTREYHEIIFNIFCIPYYMSIYNFSRKRK